MDPRSERIDPRLTRDGMPYPALIIGLLLAATLALGGEIVTRSRQAHARNHARDESHTHPTQPASLRLAFFLTATVMGGAAYWVARRQIELKRAAQVKSSQLIQREEAHRALIEHTPLAIFINREDRVVLANRACARLFGAPQPDQLIGKSPYELFAADCHGQIRERIQRLRERGEPVPAIQARIVRLDGSLVDVEVSAAPFVDQGVTAIHVVLRDNTERKRADESLDAARRTMEENEARLSDLNRRLNEAQAAAGIGSWETDLATSSAWWSDELYRIFEVAPVPNVPSVDDHVRYVHPDDRDLYRTELRRVLEQGRILEFDLRVITSSGRLRYCNARAAVERNGAGTPVRLSGTFMDITDRKLADFERRRGHELLEKLARHVPGVVYQYRLFPDGRSSFPYSSAGMRDIYECEPDQLRDDATPVFGRLHPEDRQMVTDLIFESARTLQPFHCEFRVILPRQGLRWRLSNAQPERTEDGGTLWHGIITDDTQRKQAEDALRESVNEKEALLREVHHRVKNNLQVITSLLRIQEARTEAAATREVLREMQGRVRSMALLHETLHRSANLARVDLAAYIESICHHQRRASGQHETGAVRLLFDLQQVLIPADQAAPCGLIVNELLANALKHGFPLGRRGQVRIKLISRADPPGIQLTVSDDGVGLPPNFDALRDESLGLQLVSDLAKQLDGSLEVSQGAETVFRVEFSSRNRESTDA